MPRVTRQQYLTRVRWVRSVWFEHRHYFDHLSPRAQLQLHRYYNPNADWGDDVRLEQRRAIEKHIPSLPQQAGRALAQLQQAVGNDVIQPKASSSSADTQGRRVSVRAVMRPEPDIEKIARVLARMVDDMNKRV